MLSFVVAAFVGMFRGIWRLENLAFGFVFHVRHMKPAVPEISGLVGILRNKAVHGVDSARHTRFIYF